MRRLTYARAGHEVAPGATGAWGLRLRKPGLSGRLCFKINQHYAPAEPGEEAKVDRWRGPAGSKRPASCLQVAPHRQREPRWLAPDARSSRSTGATWPSTSSTAVGALGC